MADETLLIIFAKAPAAGRVKTRLTPPLSPLQAAAVHEASLGDVVQRARETGMRTQIRYADDARDYFARNFPEVDRFPQGRGDLGRRIATTFAEVFTQGPRQAIIIGSDSPTLPVAALLGASRAVRPGAVVLGPAVDGGYYLVGLHAHAWPAARPMFRDIPWSTDSVLRATMERLARGPLGVELLSPWYDIDRIEDLRVAAAHVDRRSRLGALLAQKEYSAVLAGANGEKRENHLPALPEPGGRLTGCVRGATTKAWSRESKERI